MAAEKLFTDDLTLANEHTLSKRIQHDLKLIRKYFSNKDIKVLQHPKLTDLIVIPFNIRVNFPTRGAVNGVPIMKSEPIFIQLHKINYPFKAPSAYSNRKDFPSNKLPHLNPVHNGSPASFCLHRGNINDWFAEHGIIDYVQRIESWLNDSVANKLIRSDDEFEFTRINESAGYIIFDEKEIIDYMQTLYSLNSNTQGYFFEWFNFLSDSTYDPTIHKQGVSFQYSTVLSPDKFDETIKIAKDWNDLAFKLKLNKIVIFGLTAFTKADNIYKDYFAEIPNKLGEFLNWTDSLEIPVRKALDEYLKNGLHILSCIPLCIIIRRPQKVLNHFSEFEILNFVIWVGGDFEPKNYVYNLDSPVLMLEHRYPLTFSYAKNLSGLSQDNDSDKILFIGCGAIGSKIALHFVRSGQNNITFLDNDELSPHNLIRHDLFADSIGKNKAEQLKIQSDNIFNADKTKAYQAMKESAIDLFTYNRIDLNKFSLMVDASASNTLFHLFCDYELPKSLHYCRCELTNQGNFGIVYSEGKNRNPRVDDLQITLFHLALNDSEISKWLQMEYKEQQNMNTSNEEIMVGMSCNSDTMKLSNEIISFHSATISNGIRLRSEFPSDKGIIQISKYLVDNKFNPFSTERIVIDAFDIKKVKNQSHWEVRIKAGIQKRMFSLLNADLPNETGGLLIGHINLKRKVIHITDVTPAPPDSKKLPYLFVRGKEGIPEFIKGIRRKTGGLINYVGEWHTHPTGGSQMSAQDDKAVEELRTFLDPIPYPTLILIITPTKTHPYIFGPKHIIDL